MNYQELLKIATQILFCPICNRHFSENQLIVSGLINGKVVIQTKCNDGRKPVNAVLLTKITQQNNVQQLVKIELNEVLDFSNQVKQFDGDFEKVFK